MNRFSLAGRRAPGQHGQKGVGLIEVMIAVLVVSIGFLGVAALQVYTLSTNSTAMSRSMATISAYSILDAMRVDRASALAGTYNGEVTASECALIGNATLATTQIKNWCEQLATDMGALATTKGNIFCVNASGNCTITITYKDRTNGDIQTILIKSRL